MGKRGAGLVDESGVSQRVVGVFGLLPPDSAHHVGVEGTRELDWQVDDRRGGADRVRSIKREAEADHNVRKTQVVRNKKGRDSAVVSGTRVDTCVNEDAVTTVSALANRIHDHVHSLVVASSGHSRQDGVGATAPGIGGSIPVASAQ